MIKAANLIFRSVVVAHSTVNKIKKYIYKKETTTPQALNYTSEEDGIERKLTIGT